MTKCRFCYQPIEADDLVKAERDALRREIELVRQACIAAGVPEIVDGWQRGAHDLVTALLEDSPLE